MQIQLNVDTTFEVNELTDLQKFNDMMETMNMKINKSQLAREMGVDRRTVDKYLNGYQKPDRRNRESVVDAYYPIIRALLSEDSKQRFYISTRPLAVPEGQSRAGLRGIDEMARRNLQLMD